MTIFQTIKEMKIFFLISSMAFIKLYIYVILKFYLSCFIFGDHADQPKYDDKEN